MLLSVGKDRWPLPPSPRHTPHLWLSAKLWLSGLVMSKRRPSNVSGLRDTVLQRGAAGGVTDEPAFALS